MGRILLVMMLLLAGNAFAVTRLADLNVYDRSERRWLSVYWHEGKAYVVGKPGNEYRIVLHNRSGGDLLAVVSVDGVNATTGETAAASQGGYVVDTGTTLDLKGWRKSLSSTAAFYFTELPDSYAARTGRPDNVGVIGVALFRRKAVEPSLGLDDFSGFRKQRAAPAASADQANSSAQAPRAEEKSLGTGHGRNETSLVRTVDFERATANPEEVIHIYYDSRANLLARGVIKPEVRIPQAFPGHFVPDPPARW